MIVFNKQSTYFSFLNSSLHFSSMNPVIVDTLPKGCQLMERFEGKELKFRYVNPDTGLLFKEVEGKYQQLKTMNGEVSLKFVQGKQLSHIKWSRILKNMNQKPMTAEDAKLRLQEKPVNQFYTFINLDTNKVNVIYRLKDGKNYGIVEPEA